MKWWWCIACFSILSVQAQQADILIQHGKIVDGTGNNWYYGDIAIKDNTIIAVGKLLHLAAKDTINASGYVIAPGFIDIHTHIEGDEEKNPLATNFIYDGVTTVIAGNCGLSHTNIKKYLQYIDSLHLSINVATLVGHNDVRKLVMGKANRPATTIEQKKMDSIVQNAMQDGAVGFSTGLIYIPGTYSSTKEIVSLAAIAAGFGGIYCTHMRDESDSIVLAIEEAIAIGKAANIPVEISHFKVGGQNNWGKSKQTLAMVQTARQGGLDVTIDQYPYEASSTSISTILPDWALADGDDSIKQRLHHPILRDSIIRYMLGRLKKRRLTHYSHVVVANCEADTNFNGKSIEAINLSLNKPHTSKAEAKTILFLMERGGASAVMHGMSEEDVANIMKYPFNMFASDGTIRKKGVGMPHPRSYGTNARILGKYVREKKLMSLEEAIRRMTSMPAQRFNISKRGQIQPGYIADITIFNENTIADAATYTNPHQYSKGIEFVIVNGKITLANGEHNGVRAGTVIFGKGKADAATTK